jgi:hypothetical protein
MSQTVFPGGRPGRKIAAEAPPADDKFFGMNLRQG